MDENTTHPYVGCRVTLVNRYNERNDTYEHGTVVSVQLGCNPLVRIKSDNRDEPVLFCCADLAFEGWPQKYSGRLDRECLSLEESKRENSIRVYLPFEDAVKKAAHQNFQRDVRFGIESVAGKDFGEVPDIYYEEARYLLTNEGENYMPEFHPFYHICVKDWKEPI